MLDVLGEAALRTLLLAAAVQLALWMLRIRRAQMLLAAWAVVLAASLLMPALQWATPLRLPVISSDPAGWLVGVTELQQKAVPTLSEPISTVRVQIRPAMGSWFVAAYLLVSSVMVLRLVVGVALSLRLLRDAAPTRLVSAPNAHIRISRAVAAPVTVGNVILLPPDVVDWPPAMRQAAVAHECAHVARGDFALLVLSQLNRALFWFSPLSWLLHRRLATLAELASDDHAMTVTGDRIGYAEVLLEMGRRSGPQLRGLAMARASTLPYRIERVLLDRVESSPVSWLQQSMIVVGASIVAIAAACPNFSPGAPPSWITRAQLPPALALSDGFVSGPTQAVQALPRQPPIPSQIEDATRHPSRSASPLPPATRAASQQPVSVRVAARPIPRPIVSNTHAWPLARVEQVRDRATNTQGGDAVARTVNEAVSLPRPSPPGNIETSNHRNTTGGANEVSHEPLTPRENYPPLAAPSLLKVIDQQTCDGVYLPGAVGGSGSGGWGSLNIVRAKFFREPNGRSWLKFYLGVRDPVELPVTVTGQEVEFTAGTNTSFKVLPQGMNHLTGTTQRPNGTIDFTCGEVGAHLFDRKS